MDELNRLAISAESTLSHSYYGYFYEAEIFKNSLILSENLINKFIDECFKKNPLIDNHDVYKFLCERFSSFENIKFAEVKHIIDIYDAKSHR